MKRQPKVSVIIPTYNSEDTIERCLQSAVNQTIDGLEIIIVDDRSTDSTISIIQEYSEKYDCIKILMNEKNRGSGFSKNKGLEAASGIFVGFLDSDDYIDEDYYKLLFNAAEKFRTNIACADIALKYTSKTVSTDVLTGNAYLDLSKIEIEKENGAQLIPSLFVSSHWAGASACTKIFRKTAFLNLHFFEGRCCDDLAYALPALAMEEKIAYVRGLKYYYVQREGSLENRGYDETRRDVAHAISKTISILDGIGNSEEHKKMLIMNSGIMTLRKLLMSTEEQLRTRNLEDYYKNLSDQALHYFSIENNQYIKKLLDTHYKSGERIFLEKAIKLFQQGECKQVDELYKEWFTNPAVFYPKVSIVIPVFNGSNYMRDAISSALAQTYPNIEVIVVNDGSTDNGMTDSIARSYGNRIRYFKKENGGVATALNFGIEKMEGEYFAWLSHDDIYDHNKISNEIDIVTRLEDKTTFLVGGYTVVDESGKRMYDVNLCNQFSQEELSRPLFAVFRGGINGCATLIHKSHFARVGVFDPSLPTTQDYDLWFRILRGQKLYYYNACNVKSRSHEDQGSRKSIDVHITECNNLWIKMMSSLTDEERIAIDGSPTLFYLKTLAFLESATNYKDAILYAKQQLVDNALREYRIRSNKDQTLDETVDLIRSSICNALDHVDLSLILNMPKEKPRIAFLMGEFWDGGGLTKVSMCIANMLADRFDVFLIGDNAKKRFSYTPSEKIKIVNLSTKNYSPDIIASVLQIIRADVFVMGFNCQKPLLSLYGICKTIGIKTIAWNHEFYFMPYFNSELANCVPIRNSALAEADVVIWANTFSASVYGLHHDNSIMIANPLTLCPPERKFNDRMKNIVAVGRFNDPVKNLNALLNVFKKVNDMYPDAHLYILGSYDLYQDIPDRPGYTYKMLIRDLKIPQRLLHFVGWVNDPGIYYKNAAVQLCTSHFEGFGLVITEAAACGVPSIVFSGSGFEDIISEGINGFIADRDNIDLMAERAVELLRDSNKWLQVSQAAMQLAQKYTLNNISRKWLTLLEAMIQKSPQEFRQLLKTEYSSGINYTDSRIKQIVEYYEKCVMKMVTSFNVEKIQQQCSVNNIGNGIQSYLSDIYKEEYEKMLKTLSWRITKPIRMIRLVQISCKKHGIRATIRKILNKFRRK